MDSLNRGSITILLDDFNDVRAKDSAKKCLICAEFFRQFPKCRYIVAVTEHLAPAFHTEALTWDKGFNPSRYYIRSFNTAKIRQLLVKIDATKHINVEEMLDQIMFYFEQLRIPITPLAATLFIGVLFRDKSKKNIQNEAYLVENYLETILEKLSPDDKRGELDFREKESFLSHIAFRMLKRNVTKLSVNEFEREKLDYFEWLEEDLPSPHVFEDFFRKGILRVDDGHVLFKQRFWFDFFLAKAMEKDDLKRDEVLARPDYLRYATALAYKAGLSRNDAALLNQIDKRAQAAFKDLTELHRGRDFNTISPDQTMTEITGELDKQIKLRNSPENVDRTRDALLRAAEQSGPEDAEEIDGIGQILTLYSDVLRNTRELPPENKVEYLGNNIDNYISLMWAWMFAVEQLLPNQDGKNMEKLFFRRAFSRKQEVRLNQLLQQSHRYIYQIVPMSILLYMTDHLGNPKLCRALLKVLKGKTSDVDRVFCILLMFHLDRCKGFELIEDFISTSKSAVCDFIVFLYLRIYVTEHVLEEKNVDRVIRVLEVIRNRYPRSNKNVPPHVKDTFRATILRRIELGKKGSS